MEFTNIDIINAQITSLKILLKSSDYKCLKHMDGAISDAEYEPIKNMRQNLRNQINELEKQLEEL